MSYASESTDPTPTAATASSTPAAAVTANYSGEIRRSPADGGLAVSGYLSLAVSPLGKVFGSIIWSDPTQRVKITGKQDLNTRQGDFVIRDASGTRVPGAPHLPFRLSKRNRLVGGGAMADGEASSFRLNRDVSDTGGRTLSLGATNTYTGSSSVTVNSGSLATILNDPNLGSEAVTIASGSSGSAFNGSSQVPTLTLGGTGVLNLTGATTVIVSGGTNASLPTISPEGNLLLGSTLLLVGPVTATTGTDGTSTYTGTYTSGTAGTVIVRGTATGG